MSLDTFEQSLLTELQKHVVQTSAAPVTSRRPQRRRTFGVIAAGVTTAAAAVAISLGVGLSGPAAAYAVEAQPNGDVVVTVHDLSDPSGLESALAAEGVEADVTHVAAFSQAPGHTDTARGSADCAIALVKFDGGLRFTLGASQVGSAAVLDIVTSGSRSDDVTSPVAVTWSGGAC
jgi:hypothetical protein